MALLQPVSRTEAGNFYLQWIGQAGFVLTLPSQKSICIDPYYSNSIERYEGGDSRRLWYNSFCIEYFNPDLVLCSHDHLDHTDPETLPLIYAYSDAVFYGPKSSITHMRSMKFDASRLMEISDQSEIEVDGCRIVPRKTLHTDDSLGFFVSQDKTSIYFTGDTSFDESLDFLSELSIDILIACVNGKYGNLTISEASQLALRCDAKLLVPMHFGLIPNNTVSVKEITEVCGEYKVPLQILDVEQQYLYCSNKNKGV